MLFTEKNCLCILGFDFGSVALALHVSGLGLLALALKFLALLTSFRYVCLFQGTVDNDDVCPTPDAPRSQTKAPRLDVYRPAPRVVVDTGRPVKNKPSQDQQELPDMTRLQDQGSQSKLSFFKDQPPVPSQTMYRTAVRKGYGPLPSQAQFKPTRPKAVEQVPSNAQSKTSVLQGHDPVATRTHFNTSEPTGKRELKSRAVQVPTNPLRPQNTQSQALRLEDSHMMLPQAKVKPQASQYRGKSQTQAKPFRTKPAWDDVALDDDKRKKKTDIERKRHHHNLYHRLLEDKNNIEGQSNEMTENQPTSTNEAAAAAAHDPDYAVKHRLGLVPRRSNEPKRRSEYQREFQWRAFERNSPLISAAQVHKAIIFHSVAHLLLFC